jgi:hypothetical protein
VSERRRVHFAGQLAVVVQQLLREVNAPEAFEIHSQEREIREHVSPTQAIIEVQAVEDAWAVIEAEDVVGKQIAVTVTDPAFLDPVPEQPLTPGQITPRQLFGTDDGVGRHNVIPHLSELAEMCSPLRVDRVAGRGCVDLVASTRFGVELHEQARQAAEVIGDAGALVKHEREPPVIGHPAHDDRRLRWPIVWTVKLAHAEIDIGSETAVQLHLTLAGDSARVEVTEIKKAKIDRLLELVPPLTEEHHDGAVGLGDPPYGRGAASRSTAFPLRRP